MCATNFQINYDFILSKSLKTLIYTSIELTCGNLTIKIKNSICAQISACTLKSFYNQSIKNDKVSQTKIPYTV